MTGKGKILLMFLGNETKGKAGLNIQESDGIGKDPWRKLDKTIEKLIGPSRWALLYLNVVLSARFAKLCAKRTSNTGQCRAWRKGCNKSQHRSAGYQEDIWTLQTHRRIHVSRTTEPYDGTKSINRDMTAWEIYWAELNACWKSLTTKVCM